jgi:hypothetical protein
MVGEASTAAIDEMGVISGVDPIIESSVTSRSVSEPMGTDVKGVVQDPGRTMT